jgi:putative endopeptidase
MKSTTFLLLILSGLFMVTSCHKKTAKQAGPDPLISHIDSAVKPGDDFFHFANGRWFNENPIPASESSNGLWQMIQDTINAQVRNLCESSAALKNEPKGTNKQKIGDFFYSGMDTATINKAGLTTLKPDLDKIDAVKDNKDLIRVASYIHTVSSAPFFSFWVGQDDKISNKYAVFFHQGGISLPDRNFYFDTDQQAKNIREKFVAHLTHFYLLLGYDKVKAGSAAQRMMKLETDIAKASRKSEDTRDPVRNYNKMTLKQLSSDNPNIDWTLFLETSGLKQVDTVVVGQPEFISAVNGFMKSVPLNEWKDYLKYHYVRGLTRYLDDKTYLEFFSFYNQALRGVKEPKPRWKRVVEQTNSSLGELVGQVYIKEYLPEGTKEKLLEIGNSIRDVFAGRIKSLDWMSEPTKQKALKKLGSIIMKVGYPDKWKDMSALQVDRSSYVKNVIEANKWEFGYMINKFGKPVDRTEWGMTPQTYNAYYNPSNNEIVIPGCNIIVPGFERTMADDAILYSIIGGSTFAHEITHGFDDQGCKYDENGNLNNWWTSEDSTRFYAKTKMIVEQFNQYIAVDSLHINGELTQGENIADLAGVVMGYEAFKKTPQFKNKEIIAGLSPDQRYFLGYALAWMINMRPESIANQVRSDEHSPVQYRVIGPLSNIPEFYDAFGVKEGDKMWRPEGQRIKIW